MKALFVTIAAAFAAIPGLTPLLNSAGVPPGSSSVGLFSGLSTSLACLALLLIYVNRASIQALNMRRVIIICSGLGLLAVIFVITYVSLLNYSVVTLGTQVPVYFPLWLSPHASALIQAHGGRSGTVAYFGSGGAQTLLNTEPGWSLGATTGLLLVLYAGISVCFTSAFGMAAQR